MNKGYKETVHIAQQIADVMQSKKIENEDALRSWIVDDPTSQSVVGMLTDEAKLTKEIESFDKKELCEKSLINFKKRIAASRKMKNRRLTLYGVAAAMIAVSMLVWSGQGNHDHVKKIVAEKNMVAHVQTMEVDRPTLILDNGKDVDLDRVAGDIDGSNVVKDEDSKIKYTAGLSEVSVAEKFNTLIVPSKFTYSVELSDGTKVLLNANSKLVYPVAFKKDSREVTLEGEAFFDVSKSDIPFIVKAKGVNVRVYGTKFNVNSYHADDIETVLLSGSVGVSIADRNDLLEQILKPNQLSNVNMKKGVCKVTEVDADGYVSWIKGCIKSYDSTLGDLIEKLGCWYGVDFKFMDDKKWNIPVTASFNREQSIENVMKAIEYAAKITIKKTEGGYCIY